MKLVLASSVLVCHPEYLPGVACSVKKDRQYMQIAPALALWPGAALTLVVYGINMFGDALRDLLDPRLRGGIGRYSIGKKKLKKLRETA